MRALLFCLLLPSLVWAATPTVTWDSGQPDPQGIVEVYNKDYPINIKTNSALGNGTSITVHFYWLSEGLSDTVTNSDMFYGSDFIWQGTASNSAQIGSYATSGSGSVTLTGDGSKTTFDNLKIRTIGGRGTEPPEEMLLMLVPGTGYSIPRTDRHKKIIVSESKSDSIRYELTTVRGTTVGQPVLYTLHANNQEEVIEDIVSYSFQTRNYGSEDSWTEVSDDNFCQFPAGPPNNVTYRKELCYTLQPSDEDKEIRLVVEYISSLGLQKAAISNVLGPVKKNAVSFEKTNFNVEEGVSAQLKVTLAYGRPTTSEIRVSTTPLTATGNGVDYTGQTFLATFAPWATEAIVSVPITQDNTVTNDSEADTETVRVDIHEFGLPDDIEIDNPNLAYIRIHNYKLPIVSLDNQAKQVNESGTVGLVIRTDKTVPYDDAFTVKGKAMAKDGTIIDLSDSYWGDVGVTTLGKAPWVTQDTLFCAWIPQSSRHYTTTSTAQPEVNWQSCPSGATILVKNTGTSPQEKAATPDPDPDPVLATTIESCVYSNNLSLSQVEDYAMNRTPSDNRFNRLLSALYERAVPAPLTATEANVFYQNNIGGDNESFYKAVYDTLTCVEGL